MKQHSHTSFLRVLAAATAASALACGARAQPGATSDVNVVVHATHYAVAGRAFDEVDALGAAIDAARPNSVGIDACGPGTTRVLMAAVHRLRAWPLHLHVNDSGDAACTKQAEGMRRVGQQRPRIDEDAVDRYWNGIAP